MSILINIYLLLVLVVLPLYMRDGMVMIGNAKYAFFRDRTLLFVIPVSVMLLWRIFRKEGREKPAGGENLCGKNRNRKYWSGTDSAVLLFGMASVLSFLCSNDKRTAFWGYDGWYMGLLTQLLLVWIYFAVSRGHDGEEIIWQLAGATGGVIFLLGVLNTMNFDPLGVYQGVDKLDWNRLHLFATIGNNNWYCGYASVVAGISLYYSYAGKKISRAAGMLGSFLSFASLMTQGSESAYPIIGILLLVLLVDSLECRMKLLRFLTTALMLPTACVAWNLYRRNSLRGIVMLPEDRIISVLFSEKWWIVFAATAAACFVVYYRERREMKDFLASGKFRRSILLLFVCLVVLGVVGLFLCQISDRFWSLLGRSALLHFDYSWGNNRGALWYMGFWGWLRGDWREFFVGAGPDCFANVIYSRFDVGTFVPAYEREYVVYANAHNEWLNMLVNEGLLGAVAYLAIFLCAGFRMWRSRKERPILLAGCLAVAAYMINGTFSFQQVVSTPLIFALLAMAENNLRQISYKS